MTEQLRLEGLGKSPSPPALRAGPIAKLELHCSPNWGEKAT